MNADWLIPDWPAPANVRAFMTTRAGGVSRPPWDSMNPAGHVEDDPVAVAANRAILRQSLPGEPLWLNQVHGCGVAGCGDVAPSPLPPLPAGEGNSPPSPLGGGAGGEGATLALPPQADASLAREPNHVCAILTADCLPVLFCDRAGTVVAAAHAGWRGLAAGVLEETVAHMAVPPGEILAWLGAAIGPDAFEVGDEVREAFVSQHALAAVAFRPAWPGTLDEAPRKWLADLYALARIRLAAVGVGEVYGGGLCTFADAGRFYSYRRDGRTGRMASLVWLE
ncbi:MAG: peptidoglycan editing factor PgeF [Thiobacillus sp.]|nr:peptidoglycan editing factor PgeF [Thiobacillus sp.]